MRDAIATALDEEFAGPAPDDALIQPLAAAPKASLLRFITCGSVDDGKSTLIGRLLYDNRAVFDDQLEALERDSRKFGTTGGDLDFALLVDGLSAEREQGITIDVAYRYFSTDRRAFIIADTPGHEQYTRNMATGASQAELAVILVDARRGILPQTRRHSFITSMLGIKSVIVAINKMDLVGFDQSVFDRIVDDYRALLPQLGFTDVSYIPLSAKNGDNVTTRSPASPWYTGETLLERLESAAPQTLAEADAPFRLPVQWVNRPNLDFRGYSGTIAGGRIAAGDPVLVLPGRQTARVKDVLGPDGEVSKAEAGEAVTLTLDREVDVSRGDVIVAAADRLQAVQSVEADILWMVDRPLLPGARLIARLGTAQTPAGLRALDHAIDIHTFGPRAANALLMNEIGRVTVGFDRPVVAAPYLESRELGAFILIDGFTNETVALGLVRSAGTTPATGQAPEGTPPVLATGAVQRAQAIWFGRAYGRADRRAGLLRYRALAAVAIGVLSWIFGLALPLAALLGIADFAVRPFLRLLVDQKEATVATRPDPSEVGDGAGI
ncbi:sulfate adenylyltransferase subunit CysN [Aurantimonas sp. MSK8Z-1]|uniref:sulfate adenylyltransferase subunit CysN n=1 Tax=Mangrovibrevibacter kandeliae TaxID=2968473 RepID=UPI0021173731|nr:sulfate adenylyltransferase subunit CysN [Aurantimonas sp. MSK8Z-1]MCW4115368.1 sulfate adenylyltransferase subunit CysN [Aurantimonas sp. MSK8Z-1]